MSLYLFSITKNSEAEKKLFELLEKIFPECDHPNYSIQRLGGTKFIGDFHSLGISTGYENRFYIYEFPYNCTFMILGRIEHNLLFRQNIFASTLFFTEELGKYLDYAGLFISVSTKRAAEEAKKFGFNICVENIQNIRTKRENYVLFKELK